MKYALPLVPALALAACAPTMDAPRPVNAPPPEAPAAQSSGSLLGVSVADLLARLGEPALRITEGDGMMLQFRGPACILDAYTYTGRSGRAVTHVDARDVRGNGVDREACIAAIDAAN